jgi:hypothetical protein
LRRTLDVVKEWWWTSAPSEASHFEAFCRYMAARYGTGMPTWICQGPAPAFARAFLEAFAEEEMPPPSVLDKVIDEIVLPSYAEALGFEIVDTGFHRAWSPHVSAELTSPSFHCARGPEVSLDAVRVASRRGWRAFHPVRSSVSLEDLFAMGAQRGARSEVST